MELKHKLILGGSIGLFVGIFYNLLFYFLLSSEPKIDVGILTWPLIVIMFIIAIPFFITSMIFSLFGVTTMGYLFYGMLSSLILYAAFGMLIAYIYHNIKKK